LGHGISQYTPPEHVAVLVAAVHAQSKQQRASGALNPPLHTPPKA
jgi:uroporphyrinogen decarboxylase